METGLLLENLLQRLRPAIRELAPYSSARLNAGTEELHHCLLLNANENPYPPPGKLASCPEKTWDTTGYNYYPEPQPQSLLHSLSKLYKIGPQELLVGRGSDEAIDLCIRAFCEPQDCIAIFSPTFGMYSTYAKIQGCHILDVPLEICNEAGTNNTKFVDARIPLTRFRAALETAPAPKILFVPSPLAPLGCFVEPKYLLELLQLCEQYAILMIVDEAYAEFAQVLEVRYQSVIPLLKEHPNLAVLRTLSKAYSLAGERIGCLLATAPVIRMLRKIHAPYPIPASIGHYVSRLLQDPAALRSAQEKIAILCQEHEKLINLLQSLPYISRIFRSSTNFVTVELKAPLAKLLAHCRNCGIILRALEKLPGSNTEMLRISLGNSQQMAQLEQALHNFT